MEPDKRHRHQFNSLPRAGFFTTGGFMNAIDHVERRDTSGTDKTAGSSYREAQEYADAVRRQRQAYDVCDMAEEIDELIVSLAKEGKAELIGSILINSMDMTINRRALAEVLS
jgi:hypothetical protein